jgi:arylsulfatase A-like enzyme
MRRFLLLSTLLFVLSAWFWPADPRPNVILIMTDDQGWGDLSMRGNGLLETPNIDQLARGGATIDNFYVSPLCAPTRASLLTGRHHLRTGTVSVSGGWETMRSEETTLAEVFKQNGYATGCFGKWHNGEHYPQNANGQGFDEFLGFVGGHLNNYFNATLQHNHQSESPTGFITDVLTDAAIRFMNTNNRQPFFCYIPYNAPHSPFQVPEKYYQKYKAKGLAPELATVYGMIENIDDNIGRILQNLKNQGIDQNTIVIFMSDNGPNGQRFNAGMKGIKGSTDEGGTRVPFFVNWPNKISEATKPKGIAAHIDVLPTLVELCGLNFSPIRPLDGVSLAKSLTENTLLPTGRTLISHTSGYQIKTIKAVPSAVRTDQYRLVMTTDSTLLFDINADPLQRQNIYAQNQDLAQTLKNNYDEWFSEATKRLNEPRLIAVGYADAGHIELQAPQAQKTANLRFKQGNGWANDWIVNWTTPQDTLWWDIDVVATTNYQVQLKYSCQLTRVGAMVAVGVGQRQVAATIRKVFDPPMTSSPDRVPRREVYEKRWAVLDLGRLTFPVGRHRLWVRAVHVPAYEVAELKAIVLRK